MSKRRGASKRVFTFAITRRVSADISNDDAEHHIGRGASGLVLRVSILRFRSKVLEGFALKVLGLLPPKPTVVVVTNITQRELVKYMSCDNFHSLAGGTRGFFSIDVAEEMHSKIRCQYQMTSSRDVERCSISTGCSTACAQGDRVSILNEVSKVHGEVGCVSTGHGAADA